MACMSHWIIVAYMTVPAVESSGSCSHCGCRRAGAHLETLWMGLYVFGMSPAPSSLETLWMGRCVVVATRSVDVLGLRGMRTQPPRDLMA